MYRRKFHNVNVRRIIQALHRVDTKVNKIFFHRIVIGHLAPIWIFIFPCLLKYLQWSTFQKKRYLNSKEKYIYILMLKKIVKKNEEYVMWH